MPDEPIGLSRYPEFRPFIDPTAKKVSVEPRGDGEFLVTVVGEDGGQLLLRKVGAQVELVAADNVIDFGQPLALEQCAGECTPAQYATVAQAIIDQVDRFSSAAGPDHGNLACLWSVRHIVYDALGFWITRLDGTAEFYPALVACFGNARTEDAVPPGGIVISPTAGSSIGHVGLLGTGEGNDRLIYSNSSAQALWKQNYTIGTWTARYAGLKHLPVYFFPLPRFGA